MRERTSRRHATIPAGLLLGALVLALLTAERGTAALPADQSSLSVGDVMVTEGTGTAGDGRVYRLGFTATDEHGAECTGTALVGVPHDSRKRWVDSGAVFDSFGL